MALLSQTEHSQEGLESQVPFQTQIPLDRTPSTIDVGAQHVVQTTTGGVNRSWEEPEAHHAARKSQSHIRNGEPSRSPESDDASDLKRAAKPTMDAAEHDDTGSEDSILCEPLTLLSRTVQSSAEERALKSPRITKQPFPLVDWIRRIRGDTEVERPTLPLRWCRAISRQQKAILDSEDAWSPPLPGRPARQGTIPIEILTAIAEQVDQEAERRQRSKEVLTSQDASNIPSNITSAQSPVVQPGPDLQPSTPNRHDASQAESVVAWSSSPPSARRRLLPPDSSPGRPLPQQVFISLEKAKLAFPPKSPMLASQDRLDVQGTLPSPLADGQAVDLVQRGQPADRGSNNEHTGSSQIDEFARSALPVQIPSSPPNASINTTTLMRPPKTVTHRESEILVKHTPYPMKALARDASHKITTDEAPRSSPVTGTYPEVAINTHKQRTSHNLFSSPASQSLPSHLTNKVSSKHFAEGGSEQSRKMMKRLHEEVACTTTSGISDTEQAIDEHPNKRKTTPAREPQTIVLEPSEQGIETSSDPEEKARMEEDRIRRKIEERRIARRRMAKRTLNDGHQLQSSSAPLKPDQRPVPPSSHSANRPKPTDLLMGASAYHESPGIDVTQPGASHPAQRLRTRNSPDQLSRTTNHNEASKRLYQSFIDAYTDYQGNLNAFESAIRLLFTHNLHQSLFDDFVFRMAGEYQIYRQACTERDEDALSYRNYYDKHVEQSERRNNVITKKGLEALMARLTESLITPQSASSNPSSSKLHSPALDMNTPSPRSHPKPVVEVSIFKTPQPRQSSTFARNASIECTPTAQSSKKVRHNISDTEDLTNSESRKRRSLPWSKNVQPPRIEYSMVIQPTQTQTQRRAGSSITSELTTSVENWLNRPAGGCSPELEELAPLRNAAAVNKQNRVNDPSVSLDMEPTHAPIHHATQHVPSPKTLDRTNIHLAIQTDHERPATPFMLFAREFSKLRTEKERPSRGLPINAYNW